MKHLLLPIAIAGLLLSMAKAAEAPSSAADAEISTDDSTAKRDNSATDNKDEESAPVTVTGTEDVSGVGTESKSFLEQLIDSAAGQINKCIMDFIALFGSDEPSELSEEKKPMKKQVSDDDSTDDEYDSNSDEDEKSDKSAGEKADNDVAESNDDTSTDTDNDNDPDAIVTEEPERN